MAEQHPNQPEEAESGPMQLGESVEDMLERDVFDTGLTPGGAPLAEGELSPETIARRQEALRREQANILERRQQVSQDPDLTPQDIAERKVELDEDLRRVQLQLIELSTHGDVFRPRE